MRNNIKWHKIVLFFILTFSVGNSFSQDEGKIDSVLQIINTSKHDSVRIIQYNLLSAYIRNKDANRAIEFARKSLKASNTCDCPKYLANPRDAMGLSFQMLSQYDSAIFYYNEALRIRKGLKDSVGIGTSLNDIGVGYYYQANYEKATHYFNESAKIKALTGDSVGAAQSLNNTGIMYDIAGDPSNAIKMYLEALAIYENMNNRSMMMGTYQNISLIYKGQGNNEEAKNYINQSIEIALELNDKNVLASCYDNLGIIYDSEKEYLKAFEFFQLALSKGEEVGNEASIARSCTNLAVNLEYLNEFDLALEYHLRALEIKKKTGNLASLAVAQLGIGGLYRQLGEYSKSIEYFSSGLENAKNSGYLKYVKDGHSGLSRAFFATGKYKNAYYHLEQFMILKDSVLNEDNSRMITEMESKYQNEKKELEIEKLEAKNQLKEEEIARQEIEIEHEKVVSNQRILLLYGSLGVLVLVLVLLLIAFRAYKQKRKANEIISKQKAEVESQKEEIEEQHKDITDSINYAKRIQAAILPPARIVKEYLEESFILYKPKDVVAGDFYWMEVNDDTVLFAAADCTGHGVPGAMVSVVCNNAMNRAVREFGLRQPAEILDKVTDLVIEQFEKSEEDVKDGMDIAICSLKGNKLEFSGANNPIWIIRNGEVLETKGTKQPVGRYDRRRPFENHSMKLQDGDSIYVFTDGYVDQFGGEKGKKFKSKAFKELFLSIQSKSMAEQKNIIEQNFESWKGELEQVDDVCVIGVRV